jgi:hypothetical protein
MTSFLAPNELVWDLRTDTNGLAALSGENLPFSAQSIPGLQARNWMWCVERAGHIPVAGAQAGEQEMERIHVRLMKGYASFRCNAPDRFADVGSWQERVRNGRGSGNMPERTGWAVAKEGPRATEVRTIHPFAQQEPGRLKLHVISLANETSRTREVDVSVAGATSEHVLVLLSGRPVRWKLSVAEGTAVRSVLFYAGSKHRDISSFAGLPAGLVPVEVRLPMPIRRYGYDERFGTIRVRDDYAALSEKLLARVGVPIATFQSAVSQTSFMIR